MKTSNEYNKMEVNEYHDFFQESKHIKYNDQVADMLWKVLQESKYSKGELAERLEWGLHRLTVVLSGDVTIDIYDMVCVAGALGYKWEFNLVEVDNYE